MHNASIPPSTPGPASTGRVPRAGTVGVSALVAAGAVGIFLGAGAVTFEHAEGTSYLSNDPKACVNCHIMREQYDGWQKAGHHAFATCNDCHVPHDFLGKYYTKADHGWRHSKGFTLNDFHEPIQIKDSSRRVVLDNCVRCHEGLVGEISHFGPAPAAGAPDGSLDCIHCHARVAHGPRASGS